METILIVQLKLRGTQEEINCIKARVASLTQYEEVVSMSFLKPKYE